MHLPPQSMSPCWHVNVHCPEPSQISPATQAVPGFWSQGSEAPQKLKSTSGSMHLPPQSMRPCWQVNMHCPDPSQISPGPQAVPGFWSQGADAPQWVPLVFGSTQAPPHTMRPGWHTRVQAPEPSHTSPSGQTFPQAPQWALSVLRLTQLPPQMERPCPQDKAHTPLEQTWPIPHPQPHDPQLYGSVCRFTQSPLQFVSPCWHVTVQLPLEQTCPAGHAVPHAPQFRLSVERFTHALSQISNPDWHDSSQLPSEQTCPAGQAFPQDPQLRLSVERFTQVPLHSVSPC